eukprot:13273655-Ditylum_brightwellii.AAC.1
MVIDSSATMYMCNTKKAFTSLQTPKREAIVTLDDGTTSLKIEGIGTAHIYVNKEQIVLPNSIYIPELEVSLYSILEHACHYRNQFCSEFPENHTLSWPNTSTKANTTNELIFEAQLQPSNHHTCCRFMIHNQDVQKRGYVSKYRTRRARRKETRREKEVKQQSEVLLLECAIERAEREREALHIIPPEDETDTSLPSTILEPNPSSPPLPLEDTPPIITQLPIKTPE